MRILLALAMLAFTASCAWPPPDGAATAATPTTAPVALVPAAPAVAATPAAPFELAFPFPNLFGWGPPAAGRLTLNNFSYDAARVQALITSYPDCTVRPDTATTVVELPLNATRVIDSVPGADICWRREMAGPPPQGRHRRVSGWAEWNRAFTASGRYIDSRL